MGHKALLHSAPALCCDDHSSNAGPRRIETAVSSTAKESPFTPRPTEYLLGIQANWVGVTDNCPGSFLPSGIRRSPNSWRRPCLMPLVARLWERPETPTQPRRGRSRVRVGSPGLYRNT